MARTQIGSGWAATPGADGLHIVYPTQSITAGSVVIYRWRYESGAAAFSSFSDGTAASWTTSEYGSNPTVGYAVCLDHPGGSSVGDVTLSAARAERQGWGAEITGGGASLDTAPAGVNGTSPTASYTSTGDGTAFAVTGYFSFSSLTATSPAAIENSQNYAGFWRNDHSGSGSKSMTASGGSGNTNTLLVIVKDPSGGGSSTTPLMSHYYSMQRSA